MPIGYNPRKAAQVVSYLVRGRGGRTDIIDVIKLVYLSDRAFMDRFDRPILFDDLYCLDSGPIDSTTYDSLKVHGKLSDPWSEYLLPRKGNEIALSRELTSEDFDELSTAEERAMDDVLSEHRNRRSFALVEWIHHNCREWVSPRGTSSHLSYSDVWTALGRGDDQNMEDHINELRSLAEAHKEQ